MNRLNIIDRVIWVISISLVSYLSLMPRLDLPQTFSGADKIAHFLAYFWLSAVPFFGFSDIRRALKAALWMIGLGIGLEFGQLWVPGRQLSFFDMLANSAGVMVGILLMRNIVRPHPARR